MKYPKCPYCEYEFHADQIWHSQNKCSFPTENCGDIGEFNCPSCDEKLYVTLEMTPSWSFTDEDGDAL